MATSELKPQSPETTKPQRRFSIRIFCAGLCVVLAALLMPIGIIGYWGQNTVTNPDTFSTVVNDTVNDPVVQEEVATWATDQIVGFIAQSDVLNNAPQIKNLMNTLGFSLEPFIYPFVLNLVQSTGGKNVLGTIIKKAQTAVLNILEGNPPPATAIRNGQVVIDFNSIVDAIKEALAKRGVTLPTQLTSKEPIDVPKNLADKLPDNVRDKANEVTGGAVDKANDAINKAGDELNSAKSDAQDKVTAASEKLNSDPIVLLNQDQLEQARAIYALTVPIATWLIVFSVVLFGAAIALSTRRLRMVFKTGVLWILSAFIVWALVEIGQNQLTNAFEGSLFEKGSEIFYDLLIANLKRGSLIIGLLGAIMVLATVLVHYRDQISKLVNRAKGAEAPGQPTQPAQPEQPESTHHAVSNSANDTGAGTGSTAAGSTTV